MLELVLNSAAFRYPSKTNQMVGSCWLYLPAFIIVFVSSLLVVDIRDVCERCLVRDYCHFGFFCHVTFPTIVKWLVGVSVWLWAAFWQEDYYVCSVAGQDPQERGASVTNLKELNEYFEKASAARAKSKLYNLAVIGTMLILVTMVIFIRKSLFKDLDFLEDEYTLEEREAMWALKIFMEFFPGLRDIEDPSGDQIQRNSNGDGRGEGIHEDQGVSVAENQNEQEENKETKASFYPNSIPEKRAERKVREMFLRFKEADSDWKYHDANDHFARLYPRATTGNPRRRWVAPNSSQQESKENTPGQIHRVQRRTTPQLFSLIIHLNNLS